MQRGHELFIFGTKKAVNAHGCKWGQINPYKKGSSFCTRGMAWSWWMGRVVWGTKDRTKCGPDNVRITIVEVSISVLGSGVGMGEGWVIGGGSGISDLRVRSTWVECSNLPLAFSMSLYLAPCRASRMDTQNSSNIGLISDLNAWNLGQVTYSLSSLGTNKSTDTTTGAWSINSAWWNCVEFLERTKDGCADKAGWGKIGLR